MRGKQIDVIGALVAAAILTIMPFNATMAQQHASSHGPPAIKASPTAPTKPSQPPSTAPTPPAKPADTGFISRQRVAWVLAVLIAASTSLVCVYSLFYYLTRGYAWRFEMVATSLRETGKNAYLTLYHKDEDDLNSAGTRFTTFYKRWYGRARLGVPTAFITVATFIYGMVDAIYILQFTLPDGHALLPVPVSMTIVGAVSGSAIMVALDSIDRVRQRDVMPEDLYVSAVRLTAAIPIGYVFSLLTSIAGVAPFIAFGVAAFPLQQIRDMFEKITAKQVGVTVETATVTDALLRLSGIDAAVSERIRQIGVGTISELAYSDPVQLSMRTNLSMKFVLDLVSQAIAWNYLEDKMEKLRPMGLRGAAELCVLELEAKGDQSVHRGAQLGFNIPGTALGVGNQANAIALIQQAGPAVGLTVEQFLNVVHQVGDDRYTDFLMKAY